jgi:membrane-associated phospholipid phosphatase
MLLRLAALCGGCFVVLLLVAYGSSRARWLDASALQGFIGLQRPQVNGPATFIAHFGSPGAVVLIGALLAGVALARGRPRVALAVVVLLGATSVSSELLKALLAYPRYAGAIPGSHVTPAAFPSGHATAAMTLACACVLVSPARLRPLAAFVGAGFALAVSFSVVALGWHFPSDVVGGFLLACGFTLVVAAGLQAAAMRWPERTARTHASAARRAGVERIEAVGLATLALAGTLLVTALAVVLLLTRLPGLLGYADRHTAFFVVAAGVVFSAAALLVAVTLALRRRS